MANALPIKNACTDSLVFLAIVAAYVTTAKVGLMMAFVAEQVTVVWPPTGIALAVILLLGYRFWPAIALGAFLTNITASEPMATALGITLGNTLEAVAGAWMLRRAGFDCSLNHLHDVIKLAFLAAITATAISATIGVASLCLGGLQPWESFGSLWFLWWLGDAGGALIIAPLFLAWAYRPLRIEWQKILEGFALASGLALSCYYIFMEAPPIGIAGRAFIYVVFPFLIWAALRFGQKGTTLVTFASSVIAILATLHGLGPFAGDSVNHSLVLLQSFMIIISATGLLLSAAVVEREKSEENMRESRRRLRMLANIVTSSEDAIVSKDLKGIINSWNAGAERIFGYTPEEAIGRPITFIIPDDRKNEEVEIITRIRRGDRLEHYETRRRKKDGEEVDVSLSISPVFDEEGRLVAISKVARDITVRKKAEEALRRTEERLGAELEAMTRLHALSTHLLAHDNLSDALDDVLDGALLATKADFGHIQLYDPHKGGLEIAAQRGFQEDFLNKFRLVQLDQASPAARVMKFTERMAAEDVATDPAFESYRELAATTGFRSLYLTPLQSRDRKATGVLSIYFRDPRRVTERDQKLLELYARHAADLVERLGLINQLHESDKKKDEFLATLAHELRNPLAPIRNVLNAIKLKDDPDRRHEAMTLIEKQVKQMVSLVDDLLDISRITSGMIEIHKSPIRLDEIISSAAEMAKPLIEQRHHKLTLNLPEQPIWVEGDMTRLVQVFTNLLNNAAKFTSDGGSIEIKAVREQEEAVISIIDNGIGISEDKLAKIFDMFMQASGGLERSQSGLGIGLTLARNMLLLHGADIEARSAGLGQGSEFIVRMKTASHSVDENAAEKSYSATEESFKYRALIVDDNEDSARTLGWMLESLGCEITLAFDGANGIAIAGHEIPDIVLLDIGMPSMNGYDVCRMMKRNPKLAETVFVAQTGWGQAEYIRRSKEAGFDYHLVKPVRLEALNEILLSLDHPPGDFKSFMK